MRALTHTQSGEGGLLDAATVERDPHRPTAKHAAAPFIINLAQNYF
jgi:hypothetical protein